MVSRHLSSVVQSALNTDDKSPLRSSEICKETTIAEKSEKIFCFRNILSGTKCLCEFNSRIGDFLCVLSDLSFALVRDGFSIRIRKKHLRFSASRVQLEFQLFTF